MNEQHFAEVEKTLLYISEARERAQRAISELQRTGGEDHLLEALRHAESELAALHRRTMQRTYFAVPKAQLSL